METRIVHSALLGYYWRERAQSLDASVDFCLRVVRLLVDAGFINWVDRGQSYWVQATGAMDGSSESIRRVLELGVARHELGGQSMPELGYGINLWTDLPNGESTLLTIYVANASKWGGNCVLLKLPVAGPDCLAAARSRVERLLEPLRELCLPDRAIFCRPEELRWASGGFAPDTTAFWKYESGITPI